MCAVSPSRLKELLLKERSERCELKNRVEELEARCQSLTQQVEQARSGEEQHRAALHRLEENISQGEVMKARQQAEEVQFYKCAGGADYKVVLSVCNIRKRPFLNQNQNLLTI